MKRTIVWSSNSWSVRIGWRLWKLFRTERNFAPKATKLLVQIPNHQQVLLKHQQKPARRRGFKPPLKENYDTWKKQRGDWLLFSFKFKPALLDTSPSLNHHFVSPCLLGSLRSVPNFPYSILVDWPSTLLVSIPNNSYTVYKIRLECRLDIHLSMMVSFIVTAFTTIWIVITSYRNSLICISRTQSLSQ